MPFSYQLAVSVSINIYIIPVTSAETDIIIIIIIIIIIRRVGLVNTTPLTMGIRVPDQVISC
jgi:hypothetical protein